MKKEKVSIASTTFGFGISLCRNDNDTKNAFEFQCFVHNWLQTRLRYDFGCGEQP